MTSFVDEKHAERLRIFNRLKSASVAGFWSALKRAHYAIRFQLVGCSGRLRLSAPAGNGALSARRIAVSVLCLWSAMSIAALIPARYKASANTRTRLIRQRALPLFQQMRARCRTRPDGGCIGAALLHRKNASIQLNIHEHKIGAIVFGARSASAAVLASPAIS